MRRGQLCWQSFSLVLALQAKEHKQPVPLQMDCRIREGREVWPGSGDVAAFC